MIRAVVVLLLVALTPVTGARAAPPCEPRACLTQAVELLRSEAGTPLPEVRKKVEAPLATACGADLGQGCYLLGSLLRDGVGVTQDLPRARATLVKGCDAKDANACRILGYMIAKGEGGPVDIPGAIVPFLDACHLAHRGVPGQGPDMKQVDTLCGELHIALSNLDPHDPLHLAAAPALRALAKGAKIGHVPAASRSELRMYAAYVACATGDQEACLDLADEVTNDIVGATAWGSPRRWPWFEEPSVVQLYATACEQGLVRGCRRWGDALSERHRSDPNHAASADAWERACAAEDATACTALGNWHADCDPTRPVVAGRALCDPEAATKTWKARCDGGSKAACAAVEVLTRRAQDAATLPALLVKCDQGDLQACSDASFATRPGPQRVALGERACKGGIEGSCHTLARILSFGEGVPVDKVRGGELTRRVCNPGGGDSCAMLCAVNPGACPTR